jgi:hypothetical protein
MTRATIDGLRRLVRPEEVAQRRGKTIAEVLPVPRGGFRQAEDVEPAATVAEPETPEGASDRASEPIAEAEA